MSEIPSLDPTRLQDSLRKTADWLEACGRRDPMPQKALIDEANDLRSLAERLPALLGAERRVQELEAERDEALAELLETRRAEVATVEKLVAATARLSQYQSAVQEVEALPAVYGYKPKESLDRAAVLQLLKPHAHAAVPAPNG